MQGTLLIRFRQKGLRIGRGVAFFAAMVAAGIGCVHVRAAAGASNNWYVRAWQTGEGVTGSNIPAIVQTSDGYLWVATDNGLLRFDGVHFGDISLGALKGPTHPKISVMAMTQAGGVVMAVNRGGVVRMNLTKPMEVYNSPELTGAVPVSVLEDNDESIWVSYHVGPVYHIQQGRVEAVGTEAGLPTQKLDCQFEQDVKKNTWFMQGSYLGRVVKGKFTTLVRLSAPGGRVAAASQGGLWVCSGARLFYCSEEGVLSDRGSFTATGVIEPTAVAEDSTGAVWIGTAYTGLFCYNGKTFENVATSHEHVTCLTEDRDGNIWVGTRGGGLDRVQPRTIVLEGAETGLPSDSIQSICEDAEGTMWGVGEDGSLRKRGGGGWELMSTTARNWPGGSTAACVAADPNGGIWVGTRNFRLLHCYRGKYRVWSKSDGLNRVSNALLVAKNGDLWIGEQNPDGIRRMRDGTFQAFGLPPRSEHVRAVTEDAHGTIWVGTDGGALLRVDGDNLVDETARVKPSVDAIRCFYAAADGSLWMGTGHGGLARLKDGGIAFVDSDHGLFNNVVLQMIPDDRGWLWCAGPRGIFRVRLDQLNEVADGKLQRLQSVHYGEDQGLPNLAATFGACANAIRTRDGRLWMLMGTALAIISPEKIREQMLPPPVYIERVTLNERLLASYQGVVPVKEGEDLLTTTKEFELPADNRKLQFNFTALSFDAPANVRIQYQLENFEDGWQDDGGKRTVNYPHLDPGEYTFHVRACNSDGVWNEEGASFSFAVVPFFWQRLWFRIAGTVVFTGIVVLLARYVSFRRLRTRLRVLEQQTALQKERARIARDLHDDLGARLTEIVMLSDMTLHENGEGDPKKRVGQISTAARQVIQSLDETVWAVNPRNDSLSHLVDYIGQFAVEFLRSANIRCRVDLLENAPDHPVSAEVRHNLLLVVKEALNNIVRHSGATEAWLRVQLMKDRACMMIEDNGKGFAVPSAGNGRAEADGLLNMRHRMEEIGGRLEISSNPGSGTRISFTFPWSALPTHWRGTN